MHERMVKVHQIEIKSLQDKLEEKLKSIEKGKKTQVNAIGAITKFMENIPQ